jgi:hypothetical protein
MLITIGTAAALKAAKSAGRAVYWSVLLCHYLAEAYTSMRTQIL